MNASRLPIDALCALLRRHYVWSERVDAMCEALHAPIEHAPDGHAQAALLTERLQAVSPDRHLRVRWFEQAPLDVASDDEAAERRRRNAARADHWGLVRVERIDDAALGLVELSEFYPEPWIAEPVAEAMGRLAGVRALMFDLRRCRGGEPAGVALVASYLFDAPPVHLNDLYSRTDGRLESFWTRPDVPGPRFSDVPVFVLVSRATFSAAEEFAYDLQALARATVVGEVTRGGANPGAVHRLDDHFAVFIPDARAINPVTGDNWEGRGVVPDVACPAEQALDVARTLARETSGSRRTGGDDA